EAGGRESAGPGAAAASGARAATRRSRRRRWQSRSPAPRRLGGASRATMGPRPASSPSGHGARVHAMATSVRELELDLDAFEGPFDLLLTLVLKDQLQPADVDMAAIVVAFVQHLAERDELDLDACGEFLVLIAALLEIKARHL